MQSGRLYVEGLRYSITEEKVTVLFSHYGVVRWVEMVPGKSFGFVEMSNESEAERAKEALDGSRFEGVRLKVEEDRRY
ncbi:MAG: RNA-binding protein [Chloroflexota bacterium]|nr:RNA-binding protein [Chloroflexota bacterium]